MNNRMDIKKSKCFSPYKKYVISALIGPIFILGLFLFIGQFDNVKFLVPFILFSILIIAPILIVLPNLPACPKCEQKLGCGKENCIDWFGFERLDALFRTKCKKCEFDLTKCLER
jgi:hypothetical protein